MKTDCEGLGEPGRGSGRSCGDPAMSCTFSLCGLLRQLPPGESRGGVGVGGGAGSLLLLTQSRDSMVKETEVD